MAGRKGAKHHRVYVIRLDSKIFGKSRQFRERNPEYDPKGGRPCVYVGMTGEKIRIRFGKHLLGIKAGKKYVTRFGLGLMPELYKKCNPMTYEEAVSREKELEGDLQEMGYAVWQN
jgi:hypothetical protein